MNETEPIYITQLKDSIINLDKKLDTGFKLIKHDIGEIKGEITGMKSEITEMNDNVNNIDWIKENMVTKEDIADIVTKYDISDMATKGDIKPILNLIGSYKVRAKNTEDIVLNDHKPRIIDLEKEVFA